MPRVARLAFVFALAAGLTALAGGCGAGGPKFAPVKGKVAYADGSPVEAGERLTGYVVFHADSSKGNATGEVAQGQIQPDGSFSLLTRDKEGAFVGWYKVTVDIARTNPKDPYDYKPLIPERYKAPDKSGLTAEVVETAEPGRYDLKVEKLPGK
jgi:hypothetical protein